MRVKEWPRFAILSALCGVGATAGNSASAQKSYEPAPARQAADLLGPKLAKGPHYTVDNAVGSDGFWNLYRIQSDYGSFDGRSST